MRCFRVDEVAVVGIHLSPTESGLCVEVGDKQLPIDTALSGQLLAAKNGVTEKLETCLQEKVYKRKTLDEGELAQVAELAERTRHESVSLMYADIEGKKKIVREKARSLDALVLVETGAGVDGKVTFKGTSFEEYVDDKDYRVRRRYKEEFPPPGVQVIEEGKTRQGSKCFLVRMMPSSSFRIERTGLLEGASSVLTVVWKGHKGATGVAPLQVFAPVRYQEQQ